MLVIIGRGWLSVRGDAGKRKLDDPNDFVRPITPLEEAAAKGNADAMVKLGMLYVTGKGVAQDYAKAHEWYEKAADMGNADAMVKLGWLYENGRGVALDYAQAHEWYEKAAG
jgi:uncharacterized protein